MKIPYTFNKHWYLNKFGKKQFIDSFGLSLYTKNRKINITSHSKEIDIISDCMSSVKLLTGSHESYKEE